MAEGEVFIMDATRFGLRRRPFPATPDPAFYYPSDGHERALAQLLQSLADGEGVVLLTGAPGVGKTLLIHCLLERLGSDTATAFLTNGHFRGPAGLLQTILYDLSLPYEGRGEQEMRLTLTDHLLKHFAAEQKAVVLIVDEAQHLDADLLEELRMLANLEAPGGRALQVVLVGQPSLLENLRRPELAAMRQRIAARAELGAMSLEEAADYLLHHLRSAGVRPEDLFADEAVELLARGALGVPRLLNQSAHKALALAAEAEADMVDAEAALEALAALGLEAETPAETAGVLESEEVFPRINGQAHAGLQG
jgi:type II secretory pathway predicted ATPase ExeA